MKLKHKTRELDRAYLQRCKESSPESKLEWLAAALEFSQAKKRIIKK